MKMMKVSVIVLTLLRLHCYLVAWLTITRTFTMHLHFTSLFHSSMFTKVPSISHTRITVSNIQTLQNGKQFMIPILLHFFIIKLMVQISGKFEVDIILLIQFIGSNINCLIHIRNICINGKEVKREWERKEEGER